MRRHEQIADKCTLSATTTHHYFHPALSPSLGTVHYLTTYGDIHGHQVLWRSPPVSCLCIASPFLHIKRSSGAHVVINAEKPGRAYRSSSTSLAVWKSQPLAPMLCPLIALVTCCLKAKVTGVQVGVEQQWKEIKYFEYTELFVKMKRRVETWTVAKLKKWHLLLYLVYKKSGNSNLCDQFGLL